MMLFEEFKKSVFVLPAETASRWRERYIRAFVDTSLGFYREHFQTLEPCSDGMFYDGYLWDCIRPIRSIKPKEFSAELNVEDRRVMVMWDLHSCGKIPIENYWKFGRSDVLLFESPLLAECLGYLPEDIYVFDDSLEWTLIATHESGIDGERVCALATIEPT